MWFAFIFCGAKKSAFFSVGCNRRNVRPGRFDGAFPNGQTPRPRRRFRTVGTCGLVAFDGAFPTVKPAPASSVPYRRNVRPRRRFVPSERAAGSGACLASRLLKPRPRCPFLPSERVAWFTPPCAARYAGAALPARRYGLDIAVYGKS